MYTVVVAFGAVLAGCGSPSSTSGEGGALATPRPVQSATPAPPWGSDDRADLQRTLAATLTSDVMERDTGIVVVSAEGDVLFDRRGETPVAPASTLKLVIGATALNRLGPNYRFHTKFVATQPVDDDGVLHGGLWLVGGGDPVLSSDDMRRGVGALSRSGVHRIDGALAIDDTAFAGQEQNPHWAPDDFDYDYASATSAISVDENVVEFDVTPDANGGNAAVEVVPENATIAFSGSIATSGSDSNVSIERKADLPTFGASEADAAETQPRNEYVLDGNIVAGEMQKFYKPVLGVPGYVAGIVTAMLQARNIDVLGETRVQPAPPNALTLWDHPSPTLADIERDMLVHSNNHTAETLLRAIGKTTTHPGTDASGIAAEKAELARLGVPRERLMLYDGSGLSPDDRIMPLTLARLLAAEVRSPYGDVFVRALPRVGFEGTVKNHELHAALGRTRAKSGHIGGVNALAGIVQTMHHGRVAFAIVVNTDGNANADDVYHEMDAALDEIAKR